MVKTYTRLLALTALVGLLAQAPTLTHAQAKGKNRNEALSKDRAQAHGSARPAPPARHEQGARTSAPPAPKKGKVRR